MAFCAGNSPVTGEFPAQRPVTLSFGFFFDLRLNRQLSKQWRRWWFETLLRSLWCHCNDCKILRSQPYVWFQGRYPPGGPLSIGLVNIADQQEYEEKQNQDNDDDEGDEPSMETSRVVLLSVLGQGCGGILNLGETTIRGYQHEKMNPSITRNQRVTGLHLCFNVHCIRMSISSHCPYHCHHVHCIDVNIISLPLPLLHVHCIDVNIISLPLPLHPCTLYRCQYHLTALTAAPCTLYRCQYQLTALTIAPMYNWCQYHLTVLTIAPCTLYRCSYHFPMKTVLMQISPTVLIQNLILPYDIMCQG